MYLGIDNLKFYASASDAERRKYEATADIDNEDHRAQVYSNNRKAIAEMIRTSGSAKVLQRVIRGFFNTPDHLHHQFIYFSPGSDDLKQRITANWATQIHLMEMFIEKKHKKLQGKMLRLKLEYNGSIILQQIMVVRLLADALDGDGRSLFLMEDEDILTNSPFIKVKFQNR